MVFTELVTFVIVANASIVSLNSSLMLNSVSFYQVGPDASLKTSSALPWSAASWQTTMIILFELAVCSHS